MSYPLIKIQVFSFSVAYSLVRMNRMIEVDEGGINAAVGMHFCVMFVQGVQLMS